MSTDEALKAARIERPEESRVSPPLPSRLVDLGQWSTSCSSKYFTVLEYKIILNLSSSAFDSR